MKNEKEVVFKGRIIRQTYCNNDFRIYAVDVNKDIYPDIKFTKYQSATITGEMHELGVGIEYEIRAVEQNTKYGYSYKVVNIRRDKPQDATDMYLFLQEILTANQAKTLYDVYPDIVDRVMNNRLDDIDLNKLHGIKEYTFGKIKDKIIENFGLAELVVEFQGLLSLPMLKKLYDKYSSINLIKKNLREDPYKCLCGLARVGFTTADSILLELEKTSKENIEKGDKPIIDFDGDLKRANTDAYHVYYIFLKKMKKRDIHKWLLLI